MATTLLRRRIFRQTANLLVPKRGSYRHHAGLFLLGSMVTTATTRTSTTAFCQDENGLPKDSDGNIDWMKSLTKVGNTSFWHEIATVAGSKAQGAIDSGVPTQLSYGFVCGYCAGYALKTAGKAVAVVVGLGFMSMQTLAYNGYINVNHAKIEKDVYSLMDFNNDGKVDAADRAILMNKVMKVGAFGLPAGSGFAAGFVGGLR